MSSFNFRKLKQPDLKHYIRHCDRKARLKDEHSNIHINKSLTKNNAQLKRSYEETCKLFDDTLADLDRRPKANHRVDRVVAYAIEGSLPKSEDDNEESNRQTDLQWVKGVIDILKNDYPEIVLLQANIHRDEIHEYMDPETKELVMSRPHVHLFVMPIVEGKLNSKKFFPNKKSFFDFNQKLDELTISLYGHPYGDGTKKRSRSTVERLKIASENAELEERRKAAAEQEKDLINREVALRQQEQIIDKREQELNRKEAKMMGFLDSSIGKRAMQEYNASISTDVRPRGKKQCGKIGPVVETEIEIK